MAAREAPVQERAGAGPAGEPPQGRTPVYLVCSPQGRVGTTLTARLLLDFVLSGSPRALGFDTNCHEPGLGVVFPRATTVIDLASTRGQMALFDSLVGGDGAPKVVDLWHVSYATFFQRATDLSFFEEAFARGVEPLVLLHTDRKQRHLEEVGALLSRWPLLDVTLVHNEGLSQRRDLAQAHPVARLAARPLVVPELSPLIRRVLEEPDLRVHRFLQAPPSAEHLALRATIRESLAPTFEQFRLVEMARGVGLPARSLLPLGNAVGRGGG